MANISERGIVLKRSDYGEGNCMLTLFTLGSGIIKAVIYGVKRGRNNSKAASGQFLCLADYELYGGRGGAASVNSASIIDAFLPAAESIEKLSLCNYIAETVITMLGENNPDPRLFRIVLNCVYALAYRDYDVMKVKSAFEIKLMCAEGYAPTLTGCVSCGSGDIRAFDIHAGGMVCAACTGAHSRRISADAYRVLRYLTECDDRRMLAFKGNETLIKEIGELSEGYLLYQCDRGFKSLDYFKSIFK